MTLLRPATFAIPGDITALTGGYIYERRLLEGLRDQGRDVHQRRNAQAEAAIEVNHGTKAPLG